MNLLKIFKYSASNRFKNFKQKNIVDENSMDKSRAIISKMKIKVGEIRKNLIDVLRIEKLYIFSLFFSRLLSLDKGWTTMT